MIGARFTKQHITKRKGEKHEQKEKRRCREYDDRHPRMCEINEAFTKTFQKKRETVCTRQD